MQLMLIGAILIGFGILYQYKPNLFKRWLWRRTSLAQRQAYMSVQEGDGSDISGRP